MPRQPWHRVASFYPRRRINTTLFTIFGSSDSRMRRASPGDFQGISPVSNGTYLRFASSDTMDLSGETESGSAGTQPDKGYPGSGAPMARRGP